MFGYIAFVSSVWMFSRIFNVYQIAYMTALVFANIIAILNAFLFHKYFTFRSKVRGLRVLSELVKFSSMYLFTFFLSAFLLPVFIEVFRLPAEVAGALLLPVCMVVSYLGHSRFSFRNPSIR